MFGTQAKHKAGAHLLTLLFLCGQSISHVHMHTQTLMVLHHSGFNGKQLLQIDQHKPGSI